MTARVTASESNYGWKKIYVIPTCATKSEEKSILILYVALEWPRYGRKTGFTQKKAGDQLIDSVRNTVSIRF